LGPHGGVAGGGNVTKERERSIGRVRGTGGVTKEASSANGRILAAIVDKQRPRAYASVKVGIA